MSEVLNYLQPHEKKLYDDIQEKLKELRKVKGKLYRRAQQRKYARDPVFNEKHYQARISRKRKREEISRLDKTPSITLSNF